MSQFRYFFEPGSGICLWSDDEAARARFGYAVVLDEFDLPEEVADSAYALIARFDSSIDFADPAGASPWSAADHARFAQDAAALLARLRACMPEGVTIIDKTGCQDAPVMTGAALDDSMR